MIDQVINALNHNVHAWFSSPNPTLQNLCWSFCIIMFIGCVAVITMITNYQHHTHIVKRICFIILASAVLIGSGIYVHARHYQKITAKTQQTVLREYAKKVPEITVIETEDDQILVYKGIVNEANAFVEKPELMLITEPNPVNPHFEHGHKIKNFEIKKIEHHNTLKFLTYWWQQIAK